MRACGLMSGTSLDGIDAAYVTLLPRGDRVDVALLRHERHAFADELRSRLLAALPPNAPSPEEVARLDGEVGAALARAAEAVCGGDGVDFIASHGITLFHDGTAGRTVQIGDPYVIRERLGATVAFDFRRADCAAGGHGAPLVPYVDALLFGDAARATVALNLGGIANVGIVPPRDAGEPVRGWDTGPGNMLLDAFVAARTDGRERFDEGGAHALRGRVAASALDAMLAAPFFARVPPKSTGREAFGATFLAEHDARLAPLSLEDGCATLAALTAEAVARDVRRFGPARARVVVSGGGAHNAAILHELRARLGDGFELCLADALGYSGTAKEAVAFAVLGYELLRGRAAGMPSVTGAARPVLLGALAPHDLGGLLGRIAAEAELVPQ